MSNSEDSKNILTDVLERFIRMCDTVKQNKNYDRVDLAETIQRLSIEALNKHKNDTDSKR